VFLLIKLCKETTFWQHKLTFNEVLNSKSNVSKYQGNMTSLYPQIRVTKEPNLQATAKVNKEAIHIMADFSYSF